MGKEHTSQSRRPRFNPWVRKIPWRSKWQPTPVSLPAASHGRGGWRATVRGSQLVGHHLVSKQQQRTLVRSILLFQFLIKSKMHCTLRSKNSAASQWFWNQWGERARFHSTDSRTNWKLRRPWACALRRGLRYSGMAQQEPRETHCGRRTLCPLPSGSKRASSSPCFIRRSFLSSTG